MLEMCKLFSVHIIWNLEVISYLCRGVIGLLVNWVQHSDIVFVVVWVMAFPAKRGYWATWLSF